MEKHSIKHIHIQKENNINYGDSYLSVRKSTDSDRSLNKLQRKRNNNKRSNTSLDGTY